MLLLQATYSAAQDFSWGPKVGVTQQSFFGPNDKFPDDLGYLGGVFGRIQFAGFYIQPEVWLHYTVREYNISSPDKAHYQKFVVPVLVGKRFFKLLRINAGPVLGLHNEGVNSFSDIKLKIKDYSMGAQAGIGVDFWKMTADLKYQFNLNFISEDFGTKSGQYNQRPSGSFFLLELGYKID